MAKIKLGKMGDSAFTSAMQYLLTQKLPAKTAWKVKGLVNSFNGELKKFAELRKEIIERYCKKDDKGAPVLDEGNNYTFDAEHLPEVTKEINELSSIDYEFVALTLEELGNIDITTQQLFDLGEVIDA